MSASAPGFHKWREAPDEVAFLRSRHRHLFYFRMEFLVGETDREVEFYLARRELMAVLVAMPRSKDGVEFSGRSCEQIAEEIWACLPEEYKPNAIEVWEDRENGARVQWE